MAINNICVCNGNGFNQPPPPPPPPTNQRATETKHNCEPHFRCVCDQCVFPSWKKVPLLYVSGACRSVGSEDSGVKIRCGLTRPVFRISSAKSKRVWVCVFEGMWEKVLEGGGGRHYRWFSTPSALLKPYTPCVFEVSTQSRPLCVLNLPRKPDQTRERVWWLT